MELYYTVEELARTLKVSEEAIRKRLRGGEIRGVRLGRTWRVPREEAARLLGGKEALEAFSPKPRRRRALGKGRSPPAAKLTPGAAHLTYTTPGGPKARLGAPVESPSGVFGNLEAQEPRISKRFLLAGGAVQGRVGACRTHLQAVGLRLGQGL